MRRCCQGCQAQGTCSKCHFPFPGPPGHGSQLSRVLGLEAWESRSARPFAAAPSLWQPCPCPHPTPHTNRVQSPFCLESHLEKFLRPSSDLACF